MNNWKFQKRLAQELPRWQQQGWVNAEGKQAILADLAARQAGPTWAAWLALAGALLLGVGVITWFAAHWNEINKLTKLALIFLALTGAHLAHGFCMTRNALPKLAQGMALLSVLFFGAAIMLIGQIYHIDAHFPDGIALWAAGGLLTAWLLGSHAALLTSIALAAIWTCTEQFSYRTMNWPLLCYLALAAVPLVRHEWKLAARSWAALCVLWTIGWHAHPFFGEAHAPMRLLALQVLGLAGCWALAQASHQPIARAARSVFLLAALAAAFVLTFPDFGLQHNDAVIELAPWAAGLAGAAAFFATGVACLVHRSELSASRLRLGIALASCFALMLALEVLMPRHNGLPALVWNAMFLGLLYWIGDLGIRRAERALLNSAFAGFAALLLARYFDTFWSLLDRALFFIAGGLLLLAGGAWLERRRRKLLQRMQDGASS